MSLLRDSHNLTVDGRPVRIVGRSGPVRATWELYEGDRLLDERTVISGSIDLAGALTTGTEVNVTVKQSLVGPTRVSVYVEGELLADFDGFVA